MLLVDLGWKLAMSGRSPAGSHAVNGPRDARHCSYCEAGEARRGDTNADIDTKALTARRLLSAGNVHRDRCWLTGGDQFGVTGHRHDQQRPGLAPGRPRISVAAPSDLAHPRARDINPERSPLRPESPTQCTQMWRSRALQGMCVRASDLVIGVARLRGGVPAEAVLRLLDGHVGLNCSSKCLTWAVAKVLYTALAAFEPVFDRDVRIHGSKMQKWKGLDQNLINTRFFLTISRNKRRNMTETNPPMTVP